MYSLIIVLIAIFLVVLLALATLYFGGHAMDEATVRVAATAVINQSSQISAAGALAERDGKGWPVGQLAFTAEYLTMPTPPVTAYLPQTRPKPQDWEYYTPDSHSFGIRNKLSKKVCMEINRQLGQYGIPMSLPLNPARVCYGVAEPYSFFNTAADSKPEPQAALIAQSVAVATQVLSTSPVNTVVADVSPPVAATSVNTSTPGYPVLCASGVILGSGVCAGGTLIPSTDTSTPPPPPPTPVYTVSERPGVLLTDGTNAKYGDASFTLCSTNLPAGSMTMDSVLYVGSAQLKPVAVFTPYGAQCAGIPGAPPMPAGIVPIKLVNTDGTVATGTVQYVDSVAPTPTVNSISQTQGSARVSTEAIVSGSGFMPGVQVFAQETPVKTTYIDSNTVKVVLPTLAQIGFGERPNVPVNITISAANPGSIDSDSWQHRTTFFYAPPPVINGFSSQVPMPGETVFVWGNGMSPGSVVMVGDVKVTPALDQYSSSMTFVMPSLPTGAYTLSFQALGYAPVSAPSSLIVPGTPVMDKTTVSATGGETVTITGTPLMSGVFVTVNGKTVSSTLVDNNTLKFVAPGMSAGSYAVMIGFPTSPPQAVATPLKFEVKAGTPELNKSTVSALGGDTVTVTSGSIAPGTYVTVDGRSAPSTVVDSTTLTFVAPAMDPGTYDVKIVTPAGDVKAVYPRLTFEYPAGTAVLYWSPVWSGGGDTVFVQGAPVEPGSYVTVNGQQTESTVTDETSISFVSPALPHGTYDVHIVSPSGKTTPVYPRLTFYE